jgi:hypothetical protein
MYSTKIKASFYAINYYFFAGLAYRGKDIVCRFIIEYNSLRDFFP